MTILDEIGSPADIRNLSLAELRLLAEEIRQRILQTVSVNGGHLASSLGAVELTLALHTVYETPRDRLVWDVGHQGYAHKLVTGRSRDFHTLRKPNGISGFLRRCESEYDVFGAGHAGTSISAAVGLAKARDLLGQTHKVVAVIGDGSLTCGLPFEGLNNGGHLQTDMLVVLNDNEMSITENVGALSRYLNWIVQSPLYNKSKQEARQWVLRTPLGEQVKRIVHRLEESTKGLILPSIFFEDLGFRYIGPVDGHHLEDLIGTLRRIRDFKGPVLLHAVTRKGKGYKLAEGDAIFWHSPPNFEVDTGECRKSAATTYTSVYGDTLCQLAERDRRIVAITAAMATGTGLVDFSRRFPERFMDVGIAEAHAVTSAAGLAIEGLRPFVTIYSTFLQRAFDSIVHDVALQNLPVVFAMDRAGLVGNDGPTHHGVFDVAFLRIIPNMVVMAPRDGDELRDMIYTAANFTAGPIAFRYPRAGAKVTEGREPRLLPIGQAEVIRDTDGPAAILSYGHVFGHVMAAADALAAEGIPVTVVNARFVKPLDREMLRRVAATHPVIVSVEDGVAAGGFGSAVNEALVEMGIEARCHIIGVPDVFVEHGDQATQQEICGLTAERIVERILALVSNLTHGVDACPTEALSAIPAEARAVRR
jgi:1-deoxy-D-xylulose-5-phosphate synthase